MTLLEEANALFKELKKSTPPQFDSLMEFMKNAKAEGALDGKAKNLTLVSLAVANQCDWCIAVHVANAVKSGASREEILEAAWLAVLMGGGPKLMYLKVVLDEVGLHFS
ncbi:carboxymuconolactone decarboxylase family protein [Desulfovibrio aminophilus]|nr:carboxymuconolactone decarboxylase family protein [Desulfovibrio aminophilus]MCM0755009.1 carboxymuconolactone decarboxylase family protein [Desulfovibrio aminophilus]